MKLRIAALLAILCLAAGSASAQSIGLYWDTAAATCNGNNAPFTQGTMYVLALRGGAASGGLTGAEFRVDNFPVSTWFPSVTPNPASNVAIGAILSGGGNIAFPTCQTGTANVILLYTVTYFASDAQSNRVLSVLKHSAPSNPNFQCPLMVLCDSPVFTKVCVTGSQGIINGPPCTVSVEDKSWSAVKGLYN
jgi:hypothetical protein